MSDFEQQLRTGLRRVADEAHEPFDPTGQVRERITRRARRRRTRLAAGAVAATLAVGGGALTLASGRSGNGVLSTEDLNGRTVLAAAVDETAAAGSFRFETTVDGLGGAGFGTGFAIADGLRAEGVFDYGARRGRVTSQLPAGFPIGGGESVEVVLDGTVVYARLPQGLLDGFLRVPEGKEWVRLDSAEHGGAPTAAGGVFGSFFSGGDPAATLDRLRQEGATIEEVGQEDVRGVATTRHRFSFDHDAAPGTSVDEAGPLDDHALAGEAWIDDDGRLRRVTTSTSDGSPLGQDDAGGTATEPSVTTTTEFFDFGTAVDVSPPPAEATVDASELAFSQFGGRSPAERD